MHDQHIGMLDWTLTPKQVKRQNIRFFTPTDPPVPSLVIYLNESVLRHYNETDLLELTSITSIESLSITVGVEKKE